MTSSAAPAGSTSGGRPSPRAGVHIQIGLGTLFGLDDRPGEIDGWGSVPASVARDIVARQQRCEWRFAVHDELGRLLAEGITRRRPRPPDTGPVPPTQLVDAPLVDAVVELLVPAELLADLTAPSPPAVSPYGVQPTPCTGPDAALTPAVARWADVLADIARQPGDRRRDDRDPRARFPSRSQRRRAEIRYRRCMFPGCRRPARRSDIDHRQDHGRGGATDDENLEPLCRRHHQNKTERGWRLLRLDETRFCWISPLGRRHLVVVPAVAPPLPEPAPRSAAEVDACCGPDEDDQWAAMTFELADRACGADSGCWVAPRSMPPTGADARHRRATATVGDDVPPF